MTSKALRARSLVVRLVSLSFVALAAASCARSRARAPEAPPPAALAAAAATPAGPAAAALAADAAPLPIDPAVRVARLPNGLTYYVRAHGKPEKRASLRLAVNAGSVLEEEGQRGLAHFVEHMAFNGTRLFQKQEIVDYMERVGMRFGQDANASTSFDETIYTFEVPTDDPEILEKGLVMLQQIAGDVLFDPAEVERERRVVIEEWRLGLGAGMRVMEQILPAIFKGSRYAERLPIGTKDVLDKAKAADLRRFYETWYRPDLMAVTVVGEIDVGKTQARVREIFSRLPKPKTPLARPQHPVPEQPGTLVAIAKDKELPSTTVGVLHKLPHRSEASARDYRRHIVDSLYHDMMNARLEEQTRAKDAPFLFAASTTQPLVRPTEIFAQLAGVKQGEAARGLEALTREVQRVDRHGFTAGELERAKSERRRRMEGLEAEREKLPSGSFADEMVRNFLTGEAMPGIKAELELHDRYLPTISLDEMNRVARELITEKNRVVLVQAPEAVAVPAPAALLSTFERVVKEELAPYVDRVTEGPLVGKLPAPGRIVKRRTVDPLGATEWRLSNGVTVVLKPTDFKNDEVLVSAFSPGGHSLASARDFLSAAFAADLVGASGLGALDPTALRNALAGKLVAATPAISELEEGIAGRASPKDLETLLQLVHLTFTAPRRDEAVFMAFQAQLAEQLANRKADPEAVFTEERERVIYSNHPRRRPLEAGDEKKVALDRALRFYKQRFADAGGFTFVIVGSVTPEAVEPLVLKYLGALPSTGRRERWRDVGVRAVRGEKRFEVAQGIAPKSTVSLTFTGEQAWSREEEHLFDQLLEALGIRLRERLREELGATYGVRVDGALVRRPRGEYRVDIVFSCAPEQVDKAIAAVWEQIGQAQANGFAALYVEKVQAAARRSLEQALRTNGFWAARLANAWRHGTDPALILQEGKLIDALTSARLQDGARRYFDRKGVVIGVLKPAGAVGLAPSPAR